MTTCWTKKIEEIEGRPVSIFWCPSRWIAATAKFFAVLRGLRRPDEMRITKYKARKKWLSANRLFLPRCRISDCTDTSWTRTNYACRNPFARVTLALIYQTYELPTTISALLSQNFWLTSPRMYHSSSFPHKISHAHRFISLWFNPHPTARRFAH